MIPTLNFTFSLNCIWPQLPFSSLELSRMALNFSLFRCFFRNSALCFPCFIGFQLKFLGAYHILPKSAFLKSKTFLNSSKCSWPKEHLESNETMITKPSMPHTSTLVFIRASFPTLSSEPPVTVNSFRCLHEETRASFPQESFCSSMAIWGLY